METYYAIRPELLARVRAEHPGAQIAWGWNRITDCINPARLSNWPGRLRHALDVKNLATIEDLREADLLLYEEVRLTASYANFVLDTLLMYKFSLGGL